MIETGIIIGVVTPLFVIQLYNARQIASLKSKINLIYDNLDIKLDFKNR